MPFCSQCGNRVDDRDIFCGRCGTRQPVGAAAAADPFAGLTPRTAAILCYVPFLGWIPAIVVLAADKFRNHRTVRFHAFQGLYLFVAMLLEDWVLRPFFRHMPGFHIDDLIKLALVGLSIFMMIKAANEERYSLPIIGELAERSLAER